MELRRLRSFVAIVEEGGFSAAARKLHIAQPALTRQVQELEEEIGVRLLWRTKRAVSPTAAGERLLVDARRLLDQSREAVLAAQSAARGEAGRLSIGFFSPPSAPFIPGLVRAFRRNHPAVRVELREMNPAEQIEAFERQEIDFGFSRPVPEGARAFLSEELLYRDRLVVALPQGHRLERRRQKRIAPAELAGEDFVLLARSEAPQLVDQMISVCVGAGFSPHVRQEGKSPFAILVCVAAGLGITLLSSSVRSMGVPGVAFRELTTPFPPVDFVAVWSREQPSPTAAAFLGIVRSWVPEIRKTMLA